MPNLGPRNASTRTHRRWTEREAAEILAAQEASGLTVKEFASREGVSPQRLWRWRRARVSGVETPVFEEVARPAPVALCREPLIAVPQQPFEVVLSRGRIVRVPPLFDGDALRRLLMIVEEVAAC